MKQKKYYWQPELSTAIICWSCTFAILFISLILALENTRPYLVSNIVLAVFFFVALLGLNRHFTLTDQELSIYYWISLYKKKINLTHIRSIKVGKTCVELFSEEFQSGSCLFIMTKKQKERFVEALQKNPNTAEKIFSDNQLKWLRHD